MMTKWWLWLLMLALPAVASQGLYDFDNDKQRQRFYQLTEQLRCPKCQNQSIGDSDAPISQDMRRKTAQLIKEGRSNEEIIAYFVKRYGEFVNFDPPLKPKTLLLWAGPVLVFLAGAALVLVQLRRARGAPTDEDE
jgi:cytochrome c-type biogenesis protein CcmH